MRLQGAAPEAGPPKMAEIPPEVQARLGDPKNTEEASIDELKAILKEYYDRSVSEWGNEGCSSGISTVYITLLGPGD